MQSFLKIVLSTLAAAIGVQSKKNHEEDFEKSSPWPFIIAGIVFTILFMLALIFAAKMAIGQLTG